MRAFTLTPDVIAAAPPAPLTLRSKFWSSVRQKPSWRDMCSPQEVKTANAHVHMWKKAAETKDVAWTLIMEETAAQTGRPIPDVSTWPQDCSVIMFGWDEGGDRNSSETFTKKIRPLRGTYAYAIRNEHAQKLLDACVPLHGRIDSVIDVAQDLGSIPQVMFMSQPAFRKSAVLAENSQYKALMIPDNNAVIIVILIFPWFILLALIITLVVMVMAMQRQARKVR